MGSVGIANVKVVLIEFENFENFENFEEVIHTFTLEIGAESIGTDLVYKFKTPITQDGYGHTLVLRTNESLDEINTLTLTVEEVMLQEGKYSTSYAPYITHVSDAFKGSTVINGGLMMTNLLQLRNLEEQVVAGMSGLNNDNITLWSGGNYQDAIDAVSGTNKLPIPY